MYKYVARFNDTDFIIKELPNLNDSSRETKFSSIEIDFRGKDDSLIPIQLQEIKIVEIDESDVEKVIMTCYAESVEYPEFNFEAQSFFLTINILSPYAYSSKRTISTTINAVGLSDAILTVLAPLLDDGFTVETNNLGDKPVSEIFKAETIEKVMNYLANKFKFAWFIDKDKKIYLNQIDDLTAQEPVLTVTTGNKNFLQKIKPSKELVDYANKLVIKNAILLTGENDLIQMTGEQLVNGSYYTFKYPISLSINANSRFDTSIFNIYPFWLLFANSTNYFVRWDGSSFTYSGVGIDGITAEQPVMLIPDADDPTKMTGFRLTTTVASNVSECLSDIALVPYRATYIDAVEISKVKDKLNTSGVVEKIVDVNGKYFVINELESFAINLFSQNNIVTNDLDCTFKGRLNDSDFQNVLDVMKITKVFNVELPDFNVSGNFIITDVSYSANGQTATLGVKARNYNLNENYLDIYRVDLEQEQETNIGDDLVVFYNQDENVVVAKEVYVNGVLVNEDM